LTDVEAPRAVELLAADAGEPPDPAEVQVRAIIPRFGPTQAEVDYLFTAPVVERAGQAATGPAAQTALAGEAGEPQEQVRAVRVEATWAPGQLRPYLATPNALRRFMASATELDVRGYTIVPGSYATWPPLVRAFADETSSSPE
jgi:hypothetical protein